MRTSVERLRTGLLVGAGLLVLVISAFLGYARYKVHRALVELPGRLGATITKEFNGWTFSQSDGKKTVFTIHASKAVEHTDGMLTLHDVSMILYGKKGDRADRISGDEFEYDTKNEVIRAVGIVHLDLEAPVAEGTRTTEAAKHLDPQSGQGGVGSESRLVHVKTSGLVYMKKLGVAATAQGIEFAFGGFTGHAVGAEYDSDTGHVVLQSALTMSGLHGSGKNGGKPIAMTASHGELDRVQNVAEFTDAHYSSAGETAQAETAKMHLRSDGTVERIEGERHVVLGAGGQESVTSDGAEVALDTESRPKSAVLVGNVHFADDEALRQANGESDQADVSFDGQGHIDHAVLQGRVRMSEVVRRIGDGAVAPSQQDLRADGVELWLVADGKDSKPQLRDAKASGNARLISVVPSTKGSETTTTKLAGDSLTAHLVSRDGVAGLSTVHGVGHTAVEQVSADGRGGSTDQKSAGEMLDAVFRPGGKGNGDVELASAVEQGGVVIDRIVPKKKTARGGGEAPGVEVQHATAAKAAFDADTDRLTLIGGSMIGDERSGEVRIRDAEGEFSAARVLLEQDSGNATADGAVKASYLQEGQTEPVHVLAARAELDHDAGRATFYGGASGGTAGLARMWQAGAGGQGGSQVEAPVLVLDQEQERLTARAETPGVLDMVHAVLASSSKTRRPTNSGKATEPPVKDAKKPLVQGVARITSSVMVYSDLQRQAEFSGGVKVLDGGGEMRAQQATVFLTPVHPSKGSQPENAASSVEAKSTAGKAGSNVAGLLGGSVERIVATQHIEIAQPGRKATGERLVYTASDQMFVLTGTATAPPTVVDATQGTTTGARLRFHSGDDSVTVLGTDGAVPARKVRTETTIQTAAGSQTGTPTGARVKQH